MFWSYLSFHTFCPPFITLIARFQGLLRITDAMVKIILNDKYIVPHRVEKMITRFVFYIYREICF